MDENQIIEPIQVQRGATMQDLVNDHINGLSGYAIAAKYGMDTEQVKRLINDADKRLMFVPKGQDAPIDAMSESLIQPLAEGEDPSNKSPRGHR